MEDWLDALDESEVVAWSFDNLIQSIVHECVASSTHEFILPLVGLGLLLRSGLRALSLVGNRPRKLCHDLQR